MQNVKHTLAEEIQIRRNEKRKFSLTYLQNFIREFVNLLAGMEFNELDTRDIFPHNIFIPFDGSSDGKNLQLGDSFEFLKLYS